jgi:rSAM/selenodomain-associated transferase 1
VSVALIVLAKAPRPGRSKTRMCPPCTPEQAASLAAASLRDTLEIVARTPAHRRVLAFDGDGEEWCPPGFELIAQRGDGLAERLASAFEDVAEPALLVAMDTPQMTPRLLGEGIRALERSDTDAVLGPALDGGYWSIGVKRPDRQLFTGVPMSSPCTYAQQRRRIAQLGLRLREQRRLRDVDTIEDARQVAREAPHSHFATALAAI